MTVAFCCVEDRREQEPGVRLLVLSFQKYIPDVPLYLFLNNGNDDFKAWIKSFSFVNLVENHQRRPGWDCKPEILLSMLEKGYEQVVWLDSDIIITGKPNLRLDDPAVFVVASERNPRGENGTRSRTEAWGLPVGRDLPTVNSCVIKTSHAHLDLLNEWLKLTQSDNYKKIRDMPFAERPIHLLGGQDLLAAHLGSEKFKELPVQQLSIGKDIIHSSGPRSFSTMDRLWCLATFAKMAPIMHNQALKPWAAAKFSHTDWFWYLTCLSLEISIYVHEAKKYRKEIGCEASWMDRKTVMGRLLTILGLNHYALRGLPLAAVYEAAWFVNRLSRKV